ncbi:hypothetical protein ACFRH9_14725 [Peribacillus butanolivorans]
MKAATKSRAEQYEKLKEQVVALKKEFQGIVVQNRIINYPDQFF